MTAVALGFDPNFVACNGALYFGAGSQLWATDGTVEGTHEVAPGASGLLTCLGRALYFWAFTNGLNVWRSDGTAGGTIQLTRIDGFTFAPFYHAFFAYAGRVYFSATQNLRGVPYLGYELWQLDHSLAGAHLVEDLNPGLADAAPAYFLGYRGAFYFIADDGTGRFLWRITSASSGIPHARN